MLLNGAIYEYDMTRKYRNTIKRIKHNQPKFHIKRRDDNPFDILHTVAQLKGITEIENYSK